jgi:hypothetical protein
MTGLGVGMSWTDAAVAEWVDGWVAAWKAAGEPVSRELKAWP